ncbi:unnamed protein product, partial [Iphiclides podalirius]
MKTIVGLCLVVASAAAVQVGYPEATSYVYRSDNGAPGSLIQLGYKQPELYAPLPLTRPVKAFEAYDLAPAPLPYIAAKPIAIEDAQEDAEEHEGLVGLNHGYEKGAGSDYGEEHHAEHGEKGSKGYETKGHHAKGESGQYGKGHSEGFYDKGQGEKSAHHDEADAHGAQHESKKSYKGGDHGHKKHFSKGEDVTGYHKVFHKDEFKKDHDFYDVADDSGHYNKHGYGKTHHQSEEGAHKKGESGAAGYEKDGFGKAGFYDKGHVDDNHEGHSAEEGQDSHYSHHDDYAKKGGSEHEKESEYEDEDSDEDKEY